jgi:hypothetical protein
MKPIYDPAAQPIADYIDDLDRHGTIDHAVAFEIKLRLARIVASPAPPPRCRYPECDLINCERPIVHAANGSLVTRYDGDHNAR